jgi:surface protein
VSDMDSMFRTAYSFDQDIELWDVSNVTEMSNMFANATSFNQSLCGWRETVDLSSVEVGTMMVEGSGGR